MSVLLGTINKLLMQRNYSPGAMNSGVPHIVKARVTTSVPPEGSCTVEGNLLAIPKSHNFRYPSLPIRQFSGLMSLMQHIFYLSG